MSAAEGELFIFHDYFRIILEVPLPEKQHFRKKAERKYYIHVIFRK